MTDEQCKKITNFCAAGNEYNLRRLWPFKIGFDDRRVFSCMVLKVIVFVLILLKKNSYL